MSDSKTQASNWQTQTVKNTKSLGIWTAAWVLSLALATFGPMFMWESGTLLSVLAIATNLALGVGLITGLSFSTLDVVNLISFDAEISHMVILMSITYAIGLTIGRRKYQ